MRILYFAGVRDVVGIAEEACELSSNVVTVADFIVFVSTLHADLAERMASVRIARNERFADASESIADGDVLALIPPVSGG